MPEVAARELFDDIERRLEPGAAWTWARSQLDVLFAAARAPQDPPDGFVPGRLLLASAWEPLDLVGRRVPGPHRAWLGKRFDAAAERGVNLWRRPGARSERIERFGFATAVGPASHDPGVTVLRIDYDIDGNPAWLRPVLDEVVEVEPRVLLGRMHVRWGSRRWALGYFALER